MLLNLNMSTYFEFDYRNEVSGIMCACACVRRARWQPDGGDVGRGAGAGAKVAADVGGAIHLLQPAGAWRARRCHCALGQDPLRRMVSLCRCGVLERRTRSLFHFMLHPDAAFYARHYARCLADGFTQLEKILRLISLFA